MINKDLIIVVRYDLEDLDEWILKMRCS